MTPDTVVQLGDFRFAAREVPEHISFGGAQRLSVHELVGGARIVDAMGRADQSLRWSGIFLGENALPRARYLDTLRVAGAPLTLSWSELIYTVVVRSFHADFRRFYHLPYEIDCTVVEDLSEPVTSIASPGIDAMISNDMASANGFGDLLGDGILSDLLSGLDTAIAAVSSFATAVQSTINTVLAPLAAVQARVKLLIATTGNTIANITTLGGILPNNPIAAQAARLTSQVTAMTQLPALYNLQSVLGRMGTNLNSIGTAGKSLAVAGGNLYGLASKYYGDATSWTTIAKANGVIDPVITGATKLKIPSLSGLSGGILSF